MIQQRIYGIIFLLFSAWIILMASRGNTVEDSNITVTGLLIPAGIGLLVTKRRVIYPCDREAVGQEVGQDGCGKRDMRVHSQQEG